MSKIVIITGGSKGIGKALVDIYLNNNYGIYSISRSFVSNKKNLKNYSCDLSDPKLAVTLLKDIFLQINLENISDITLINNAGSLGTISNIENNDTDTIQNTIALNLSTPLALSSIFIKELNNLKCRKHIINISSGAAIKPYEGWSIYCSSKAGLDMATKTIAEEQNNKINPVKINSIYPGVVETGMQTTIRKTSVESFKNVQRFIDLKKENKLYTPEYVANKIFYLDENNILENGEIVDIRNL